MRCGENVESRISRTPKDVEAIATTPQRRSRFRTSPAGGNRFFRSAGLLPVFVSACGLMLVMLEWLNTSGSLSTEFYLTLCWTLFRPLVWLVAWVHPEWIAELLKRAATP